ncbi:MAG: hypothetical protein H5U40_17600, partial [Polyangiaceae bacterium]|nr:hypothetical protein [Polyangiaceae bacterium]
MLTPDEGRRADWKHRLRRHAAVRAVDSVEAAKEELEPGRRHWLAFIVDLDGDGRAVQRMLKLMRRSAPHAPGLLITEDRPRA